MDTSSSKTPPSLQDDLIKELLSDQNLTARSTRASRRGRYAKPAPLEDRPSWHYKLPAKPTLWDRTLFPVRKFNAWFTLLKDNFEAEFVYMIFFGEHLLKGMCGNGGFMLVEGIMYMQLQVGAATKSSLQAVSASAWSLKPLYGLLSDAVLLRGYRRTPWILFTAALGVTGYFSIFKFGKAMAPAVLCMCFFAAKMQVAWTDLIMEAMWSEKIRERPKYASDIVSYAWTGIGIFSTAGVLIAGPGLDILGPYRLAGLAIPFVGAIIVPTLLGWLTEKPEEDNDGKRPSGVDWTLLTKNRNFFFCTAILTGVVLVSSGCAIARITPFNQAMVAIGCSAVAVTGATLLLPPAISKPLIYMFLAHAISLNTYGFIDNFYLDAATPAESAVTGYPVCVDCPHFSNTFYFTVVGVTDAIFMTLGAQLFNATLSTWTYRRALAVTQVVMVGVSLIDIIQFQHLHRHIGIPDTVFMLGKTAIQNTCSMLNFMPTTILISRLCPKGVESTVFALLAGFSNYGGVISNYLGAAVLSYIGMGNIGKGAVDDFSNAWKACLINALCPLVILLVMPALIPDAKISESLELEGISPIEQIEQELDCLSSARDCDIIEKSPFQHYQVQPFETPTGGVVSVALILTTSITVTLVTSLVTAFAVLFGLCFSGSLSPLSLD